MMTFKMIWDERSRINLNQLADNTKIKAYELYQYCINNKIQILIYETIRTKATQAENVKNGKSKTMNSWHLTGQALDWVLVDSKGTALWNGYKTTNGLKVINYAKSIGFTSGHDWGWDSPHLQYDKIKYGTDTYGKIKVEPIVKEDDDMFIRDASSSTLKNSFIDKLEAANKAGKIDVKWVKQAKDGSLSVVDMILLQEYIK